MRVATRQPKPADCCLEKTKVRLQTPLRWRRIRPNHRRRIRLMIAARARSRQIGGTECRSGARGVLRSIEYDKIRSGTPASCEPRARTTINQMAKQAPWMIRVRHLVSVMVTGETPKVF